MIRVKICGITCEEDLRAACEAGADAVGFIFVPGSPRYVGGHHAASRQLISATPPLVWRVGVFDAFPDDAATAFPELDAIQYYRRVKPSDAGGESATVKTASDSAPLSIKAFQVRDEASLHEIAEDRDPKAMVLLDAYAPNALGGTGHTFNWDLAVTAKRLGFPIALAGGLTPENVGEAVRAVRPYMVDVSSGVEASPGQKDHEKVRRFIRAVREADLG